MDSYFDTLPQELRVPYSELYGFFKDNFKNPAQLLAFYDKELREGTYNFHTWQAKIHNEIFSKDYTSELPLELVLQAVNGSGKDLMVIAPFISHFLLVNLECTITCTSSSGAQLTNQTEKYLRTLCSSINSYHGFEIFDIKQRNIKCHITGGEIFLYATDDAGKAEGYHPQKPGRKFAIIINEAKSVEGKIFEALTRCSGFTHWFEVSSPGKADGHFYKNATSLRPEIKFVRVTSDDCPHLGGERYKKRIADTCGGTSGHLYKSMVLCEFSSDEEQVVLTLEKFDRCLKFPPDWCGRESDSNLVGGLDLSGGGDEQSLYVRQGNKVIAGYQWRIKDATVLVDEIIKKLEFHNMQNKIIYADAGGMGITIINFLWKRGWKTIRAIYNNSEPKNIFAYYNNGTEMWFNLANLIENNEIILEEKIKNDPILRQQLCNRYYKLVNSGNTTVSHLESKPQAKSKGHPSPDRADSLALCFMNYKTPRENKLRSNKLKSLQEAIKNDEAVRTIRDFVRSNIDRIGFDTSLSKNGTINATSDRLKNNSDKLNSQLSQLKIYENVK